LRDFLLRDMRSEDSLLHRQLEAMLSGVGGERAAYSADRA
jgi:hypothetical protein